MAIHCMGRCLNTLCQLYLSRIVFFSVETKNNMASNYEKPPVFSRGQTWKEGDLKHVDKAKIAGHHAKEEVYTYGGEKGIEFLVSKTLTDYVAATERLGWNWPDAFDNFYRVLEGSPRTTWEEVVAERPALRKLGEAGFNVATELLIKKLLNNNTPRDQQWIYMAPGGDRSFLRDISTRPSDHLRRFNEIIRISKLLPQGNGYIHTTIQCIRRCLNTLYIYGMRV